MPNFPRRERLSIEIHALIDEINRLGDLEETVDLQAFLDQAAQDLEDGLKWLAAAPEAVNREAQWLTSIERTVEDAKGRVQIVQAVVTRPPTNPAVEG